MDTQQGNVKNKFQINLLGHYAVVNLRSGKNVKIKYLRKELRRTKFTFLTMTFGDLSTTRKSKHLIS